MSFKEFLLGVLDRSVNASWYRTVGCSPDEAAFLADMEANSRNTSHRNRRLSDEEIEQILEETRKDYNETIAALEERERKLREKSPWIYEGAEKFRQEAIRIREEAKKQKQ